MTGAAQRAGTRVGGRHAPAMPRGDRARRSWPLWDVSEYPWSLPPLPGQPWPAMSSLHGSTASEAGKTEAIQRPYRGRIDAKKKAWRQERAGSLRRGHGPGMVVLLHVISCRCAGTLPHSAFFCMLLCSPLPYPGAQVQAQDGRAQGRVKACRRKWMGAMCALGQGLDVTGWEPCVRWGVA
eukprot:364463-Chlamydomonas_euryale.AAC.1